MTELLHTVVIDEHKIEPDASRQLTKCSEIYRCNLSGQYLYICYHCGSEYQSVDSVIEHVEIEHVLITDSEDFIIKENLLNEIISTNDEAIDEDPDELLKVDPCADYDPEPDEQPDDVGSILSDESLSIKNEFRSKIKKPKPNVLNCKDIERDLNFFEINYSNVPSVGNPKEYQCNHCNKIFLVKNELVNHIQIHTNDKVFHCKHCTRCYTQKKSLWGHLKFKHPNEWKKSAVICPLCYKRSANMSKFERHMRAMHITNTTQKCQLCERNCGSAKALVAHVKTVHKVEKTEEITVAPISDNAETTVAIKIEEDYTEKLNTTDEPDFWTEMSSSKFYHCDICKQAFTYKNEIVNHMKIHASAKIFHCKHCTRCYTQKKSLWAHMKSKHPDHWKKSSVMCLICQSRLTSTAKLEKHMKVVHNSAQPMFVTVSGGVVKKELELELVLDAESSFHIICRVCDEEFTDKQKYKDHLLIHADMHSFKCKICGKMFEKLYSLKRHITRHSAEKIHKCTYCPAAFIDRNNLTTHTKIHTGRDCFSCDLCDKTYSLAAALKIHKRTHTGEKPVVCDLCGWSFIQLSQLTTHMKKHGEKKHQCSTCGKKFHLAYKLNQHALTHSSVRQYKCELCDKEFSQKRGLRVHSYLHMEKRFKCKFCDMTFAQSSGRRGHEKNKHLNLMY